MYSKQTSFGGRDSSRSTGVNHRGPHRSVSRGASRTSDSSFSRPSYGSRPAYGNRRPTFGSRPVRGGRGGGKMDRIDPARFINKATAVEQVETYTPKNLFKDFHIEETLKKAIIEKGYTTPTPIQDQSIPHVLEGKDVLGIANTGTGKTAAFLIPLINKVLLNRNEQILIVVPTRELAIQIQTELRGFTGKSMKIFSVCCVGGTSIVPQIRELKYKNEFIIGTPGRLKDLIDRKMIDLKTFNTIVLDEADRMLDMGFVNDMRFLVSGMPKEKQTLFFSATLSPDIEKLVGEFLKDPVRVSVKTRDTSKNVDQDVVRVGQGGNKLDVLHDLLSKKEFGKVLIFGKTKHGVEKLSVMLQAKGFKAESIHGNKTHTHRQRALSKFKDNHSQILVATDVAARGLDIPDVTHVINFDLPATYDDYVHRIGRTGRGNKKGTALTFI